MLSESINVVDATVLRLLRTHVTKLPVQDAVYSQYKRNIFQ